MTTTAVPLRKRSMFFSGFWLMLRRPGALLWTYLFQLGLALLFSLRLHTQLSSILNHSIAAQDLRSSFDLGTVISTFARLGRHTPAAGGSQFAAVPLWLLVYFLLVPGTLFCYRLQVPAKLGTLLNVGLSFFWRFVRITLITALTMAIILGPLIALENAWAAHVDERVVGLGSILHQVPGTLIIVLVACSLRLYFDLVEAYTVQLDAQFRPNGKPDRRIRRALIPAAKTLWHNLPRALFIFVFLSTCGALVLFFLSKIAVETLAQPRVWPAFLLIQAGLLINLATRFWQRGAETVLVADYPILWVPELQPGAIITRGSLAFAYGTETIPVAPVYTTPAYTSPVYTAPVDPIPNTEPAVPSILHEEPLPPPTEDLP